MEGDDSSPQDVTDKLLAGAFEMEHVGNNVDVKLKGAAMEGVICKRGYAYTRSIGASAG